MEKNTPRKSRLLLETSSDWYGGTHGNGPYKMEASDPNAHITSICVHSASGMVIGSLQVHFSDGTSSPRYGGQNVEQQCYSPKNGCISKVYLKDCFGWYRDDLKEWWSFINSLQFQSSDGSTSAVYGYDGNTCYNTLRIISGNGCLKAITVKSGTLIDAARFHWF